MDEARIVTLIREGEINAFDEIVAAYEMPLVRYLARLTGESETARDLAQKSFLDAYKGILKTDADLSLKAWLFRIATNNALQHQRRKRILKFIPFSGLGEAASNSIAAPATDTDEKLAIESAMLKVPMEQRTCLALHFVEGFKYREIADLLGITEEAVRKRVARGSERFRNEYQAAPGGEG